MDTLTQPTVNIGLVGHVDHGKTTLNKRLTGKWADDHSEEVRRGITIRLGYADATIYKCPKCPRPDCYSTKPICPKCKSKTEPLRKVSFVDAPGHDRLMATMLSGAMVMNGALLLIAANEDCPQPQTREHLAALEIAGVKNIIIVQNKIDLVTEERAREHYKQIKEFVKGTIAENAPIIPISAHHDINIDALIEAIETYIPSSDANTEDDPLMYVLRSFDINKPGTNMNKIKGGVIGGSLMQGHLNVGDEIEIAPGRLIQENNKSRYESFITKVVSLRAGNTNVETAYAGGLLGIGTLLDPAVTKSDSLNGSMVGLPGKMPPLWNQMVLEQHLMERVVGADTETTVEPIKSRDPLMLTVGTGVTVGVVVSAREDTIEVKLKRPVVARVGDRIALSRRIHNKWRLIGYSTFLG